MRPSCALCGDKRPLFVGRLTVPLVGRILPEGAHHPRSLIKPKMCRACSRKVVPRDVLTPAVLRELCDQLGPLAGLVDPSGAFVEFARVRGAEAAAWRHEEMKYMHGVESGAKQ